MTSFRVSIGVKDEAIGMAKREARRKNPNYKQISAYIPTELAVRLKAECALKQSEISEVVEKQVKEWLEGAKSKNHEEYDRAVRYIKAVALQDPIDGFELARLASEINVDPKILHEALKKTGGKLINGHH
jgi:hypothetical protein